MIALIDPRPGTNGFGSKIPICIESIDGSFSLYELIDAIDLIGRAVSLKAVSNGIVSILMFNLSFIAAW